MNDGRLEAARARLTEIWLLEAAAELGVGGTGVAVLAAGYGWRRVPAVLAGFSCALAVQRAFIWTCRRRVGPECASPADLITLSRGACRHCWPA